MGSFNISQSYSQLYYYAKLREAMKANSNANNLHNKLIYLIFIRVCMYVNHAEGALKRRPLEGHRSVPMIEAILLANP